ncbi:hypothetical protein HNR23_002454 [Nocardiopsis mwathae]|uniref:Lon N-terminal domain-containing protein n=1 Tax=Nocardiopsis mwathae TaxID=1472723 RepID=A0A7W9YHW3_9ACTN|nr:LON peptidase substrate-binding domain-containing protein [Nocardiopsis mwathae]MBB6172394.1 hypothetical protein [Nocardiopsis mwathae]
MPDRLPIFPLGSVLFPGLTMPLHVFEERYRRLMSELLEDAAGAARRFGVVGIELGHEVGASAAHRLSEVGCVAEVRSARRHEDGGYDIVVEGGSRFRVEEVDDPDHERPYLRAATTPIPDELGTGAEEQAERVGRLFRTYCHRLTAIGIPAEPPRDAPAEPLPLSYAVSAALVVDQFDKQALLEADHAAARLELAAALMRRENRVLGALPALPADRLLRHEIHLN